jgi:sugar phosphate isomerase/epimerase
LKLGLSTWSLLGQDVYSAVEAIGDAGIEYVELWGEFPHAYPGWVDRKRLRDALSAYDMTLTLHAPFTDLNPASPDDQVRTVVGKVLAQFVDFGADLGASMVTVHPGSVHNELLVGRSESWSASTIAEMVRAAGGRLSINIENLTKSTSRYHYPLGTTLKSLQGLLAMVEGTRCTVDTGHAHASGLDPLKASEVLGEKLAEVHLSDNSGGADDHLIPGRGSAPLREFLGRIEKTDALVCLELNPHVYGKEEVLEGFAATRRMLARAGH